MPASGKYVLWSEGALLRPGGVGDLVAAVARRREAGCGGTGVVASVKSPHVAPVAGRRHGRVVVRGRGVRRLWQVAQAGRGVRAGEREVVVWLKLAGFQAGSENLWQVSQVVGKPEATWSAGSWRSGSPSCGRCSSRGAWPLKTLFDCGSVRRLWHWSRAASRACRRAEVRVVVEGALPRQVVRVLVAAVARGREAGGRVRRVLGVLVVRLVAGVAVAAACPCRRCSRGRPCTARHVNAAEGERRRRRCG